MRYLDGPPSLVFRVNVMRENEGAGKFKEGKFAHEALRREERRDGQPHALLGGRKDREPASPTGARAAYPGPRSATKANRTFSSTLRHYYDSSSWI